MFPLQACFYETCWVCIYHATNTFPGFVEQNIGVTGSRMYCWDLSWLHLPVADRVAYLTDCMWRALTHVCLCALTHSLVVPTDGCASVLKSEEEAGGRREVGAIRSVLPLNPNLLAPHGMSQWSMGECFASKARHGVLLKGALLRQSFTCLFLPSYGQRLDAQADHPDVGVLTNVLLNGIASPLRCL